MIAKRRRDLIFAIQQISYKIFEINPTDEEKYFPGFNPNTLNIMPYSLMNEILTIESQSIFKKLLVRITILSMPFCLVVIIISSFISVVKSYNLHLSIIWPSTIHDFIEMFSLYACIGVSIIFIIWIIFYYYLEFKNLVVLKTQNKSSPA
jgi:hypothetical protein